MISRVFLLTLILPVAVAAASRTRHDCRTACADQITACKGSEHPRHCRRHLMRECRHDGVEVCAAVLPPVPVSTTETTTTSTSSTTSTTWPPDTYVFEAADGCGSVDGAFLGIVRYNDRNDPDPEWDAISPYWNGACGDRYIEEMCYPIDWTNCHRIDNGKDDEICDITWQCDPGYWQPWCRGIQSLTSTDAGWDVGAYDGCTYIGTLP